MKYYDWNKDKNRWLIEVRGVEFDDVIKAIEAGDLLETVPHPNARKYPNQRQYVVVIRGYLYLVPFMEDDEKYFLKTIIPSRKAVKKYLRKS